MARPPDRAADSPTSALATDASGAGPGQRLREIACAKVNLALHVTGRRADGYHLLQSLVAFPPIGDILTAEPCDTLRLTLDGSFARRMPPPEDNLILHAARCLDPELGAHITLEKNLPVASGIGGGSADAAATLRMLSRLWNRPIPETGRLLGLGADLPVCLASAPCLMQGIGEDLTPCPPLPDLGILLVNPGVAVATGDIFAALLSPDHPPLDPLPPDFSPEGFIDWLAAQRNDLQPAAEARVPAISEVLNALTASPACLIARMSGSGSTCFALFPTENDATRAHHRLAMNHPEWWSAAARL